jgi:hypothetical protein
MMTRLSDRVAVRRRSGGGEVRSMKDQLRKAIPAIVTTVVVLVAAMLALALSASPASAYTQWEHDGATGCASCHSTPERPTDAACTNCHAGFQSYPGMTCWSCHAHGEDT